MFENPHFPRQQGVTSWESLHNITSITNCYCYFAEEKMYFSQWKYYINVPWHVQNKWKVEFGCRKAQKVGKSSKI